MALTLGGLASGGEACAGAESLELRARSWELTAKGSVLSIQSSESGAESSPLKAHRSQRVAAGYGFDMITPPAGYAAQLTGAEVGAAQGTWVRVRGLVDPVSVKAGDTRTVKTDRDGLRALRARGIKTAVFLRWERSSWSRGVRAGGGHRLPLDLREAYERGRRLGETYGDLVDVWEIENEPDIDFMADNPETYAAFQKAVYLGLCAGAAQGEGREARGERGGDRKTDSRRPVAGQPDSWTTPRVVMAPLALPPGPYLERLWANGIASYTDGFNFHYYGYAEDFSGVYGQFREAVAELGAKSLELRAESLELTAKRSDWLGRKRGLELKADGSRLTARKPFPVFITEYGFGLLDKEARDSVEGRVRQWRWFASVISQVRALRPEGPMAFLVDPYYEADLNEFGLTMKPAASFMAVAGSEQRVASRLKPEGEGGKPEAGSRTAGALRTEDGLPGTQRSTLNAQLSFTPEDFGGKKPQPWMERIGDKVGGNHASPALAYLWDYAERHPYRSRDWSVDASPASPVVIDLVAGRGMAQMKSSGGYELSSHEAVANYVLSGRAKWVLYNFSAEAITGRLEIAGEDGVASQVVERTVTLAAGERREIIDDVGVQAQVFAGRVLRASFTPEDGRVARAVWTTRLFPTSEWMVSKPAAGFDFPAESARTHRALLTKRSLAEGEPGLRVNGRWLATDGVRVEERGGVWRFHIDHLPAEPLRPAAVELPLPEGFVFAAGTALVLERRAVPRDELEANGSKLAAHSSLLNPERLKSRAGKAGDVMDVYFRTENGNLYQTWPRLRVTEDWTGYSEQVENFTMGFFGRAALPWRFADNRPAALVFFLRPSVLPAVFEVRGARIERVGRAEEK